MKKFAVLFVACAIIAGGIMMTPAQQQADLAPPNPNWCFMPTL